MMTNSHKIQTLHKFWNNMLAWSLKVVFIMSVVILKPAIGGEQH